jgi:hypothetical protein
MRLEIVAAALALAPLAASPAPTGPEFGLRAGYTVPFGNIVGDGAGGATPLKDLFTGGIPIWADAGYRFTPAFYGGVFGSYAFLFAHNCDPTADCSGHDIRLGLDLLFHLAPSAPLDPWVGLGVGYEWLLLSVTSGRQRQDLTLRGIEFLDLQLGADFAVSPGLRIGPFAAFSLGRYSDESTSGVLGSGAGEVADKKVHEWLLVGLRATFNP